LHRSCDANPESNLLSAASRFAFTNALVEVELDPDADPPKLLFIGPALSGDLLELIGRELEDDEILVHHCMKLRPQFFPLLKGYES
jgi:hypothetical protein